MSSISASRRYRSSTSASAQPPSSKAREVLSSLLNRLSSVVHAPPTSNGFPDLQALVTECRKIHQHISASEPPSSPQDDFRHLHGFQLLLDVLRSFSGFYNPQKRSQAEKKSFFEFLHMILAIFSATFREHCGNRRYFQHRVEGGGWESLEQIIASIGLGGSDSDLWTNCQLFGKLLSFSLDDQRLDALCQKVALTALERDSALRGEGVVACPSDAGREEDEEDITSQGIERRLSREVIVPTTVIQTPEILRTVVGFWESIPRNKEGNANIASLIVLTTLVSVSSVSFFNLAALHRTGVLSRFLRMVFPPDSHLSREETERLLPLCQSLMQLGVNELADAQFLLSLRDPAVSQFCLSMTEKHNGPPFVQFDLSLHGYASIELPTLGRPFPPQSSAGYTFTIWFRVDKFDPSTHTTLFGAFDSTQTCFLLAYLERDTRHFILQTSVTSQRPSVRFKSVAFREKQWYHLAIVHRKPKTLSASKASLYVNGEFAEQIKTSYPLQPPLSNGSTESFASFTSNSNKTNPVQAFLGTPRDLSTSVGPGRVFSRWSLASAHLFEDVLSDDMLAVHYRLGPRYQGNFQDCLGGFQTYEASAALGLRNEILHPGKDESSDILKAVRDKAATIVPEAKVLMSTLPVATFRSDGGFLDTLLFRSLSRAAAGTLLHLTTKAGTAIAINAAVPSVNDALIRPNGVAILSGDPVVATPYHFDDNLWRLGGFTPVALKLVERASTGEELLRSLELMLHCIDHSWRNSEAMERDNGYAILSMLLRAKMGYGLLASDELSWRLPLTPDARDKLSFQLLSLLLGFVGYNHAAPIESFIVNPLAYRVLLIDNETWRRSAPMTQELYYRQFVTFAVRSKYHQFNSRRLLRMRIIKRLLDALKGEPFAEDILPHFLQAFECLVKSNFSAEVHRSLALFITYAFHTPPSSLPRTPRPGIPSSRSSTPTPLRRLTGGNATSPTAAGGNPSKVVKKKQLAVKILEMYTKLLCVKGNTTDIRRFAKTVTNKWLLYLLAEDDSGVVVYGATILARLLVTHPQGYTAKFSSKTGGFCIMAHRLKQWWYIPALWMTLLSIMFGVDIAEVDPSRPFDLSGLLGRFANCRVVCPDVLPVVTAMLQHGLRDILRYQDDPDSPASDKDNSRSQREESETSGGAQRPAKRLPIEMESVTSHAVVLQVVVRFLAEMHRRSSNFRDFTLSSDYVRLLLWALYPMIVSADPVSPDTELNSKDSSLTFEGGDVIIRPVPGSSVTTAPIVRTASLPSSEVHHPSPLRRGTPLRRPSSFILVASQSPSQEPSPARLTHVMSPRKKVVAQQTSHVVLEGLLELVVGVFTDQVLVRKEFSGFGLFVKIPPGFQEHHAYFASYVLRSTVSQLNHSIQANKKLLVEPKVLQNMARFNHHTLEAVFEGWFINGAETMIEFTGMLLEYLQRPEVSSLKTVRLCISAVSTIRSCFLKLVLLRLSDIDEPQTTDDEASSIMGKLLYWQTALLGSLSADDDYMKLIWYQLYNRLIDSRPAVRLVAANMWRIMLVQKPEESSKLFRQVVASDQQQLTKGFGQLTEIDDSAFVEWIDRHRPSLDVAFFGSMSKAWEEFVAIENQHALDTARSRLVNRKEKLRLWQTEAEERENILVRHEMANSAWMKSIYISEHLKHQRLLQDQHDDSAFLVSAFAKMDRDLRRPGAVFSEHYPMKWKLDRTEGRNRMRLRLLPEHPSQQEEYRPKRNKSEAERSASAPRLNVATAIRADISPSPITGKGAANSPSSAQVDGPAPIDTDSNIAGTAKTDHIPESPGFAPEDDFELIEDPNDPDADDAFEDKNRKVMRRLDQGDTVQQVYNISRIVGLEACEGILIIGRGSLYIMDNVFRNADGEIVNVWQAPPEERDPFSIIIQNSSDKNSQERRPSSSLSGQESRSWRWQDVLSFSKRRFLFRDVAIEIFFTDGRSYLLTAINATLRDEIYARLMSKTPHMNGPHLLPNPEDAWRLEALRLHEETPQTLGSKFGSIFNSSPWNPVMRRWQRGEMSNFHYLMLVNTMAGRTFNDLTQYPVFPWVLADYTSDELDLDNPASFRDLSKPMGAQSASRQADFAMRYNSLAEIGETPFHYGTHYSSAMIVSSYLIRLPPFVKSYILLQGGTFDHPDRLFFSIEGAWVSASRDNGSDVRELIPEFYYLPEFLTNINGYDFGMRQGKGGRVNNVALPPWAKGDPKIFIAKHREALESPYVSQHLHEWIDLIFGCKQRGDAAVENLNVFHHLSYRGARDLDNITDPQERRIITGIIHNFGQTPHQVFTRPHPAREHVHCPIRRLDSSVQALSKMPHPLLESHERVSSLIYAPKLDRLLCASPFRLNLPPSYDKFLEWGYADNSVRFFFSDNRKPAGHFENLHIGQLSALTFADSKTLITAGEDCVVSIYNVHSSPGKAVELVPKSSLFGHKTPVTTIAVSKSLSTFVTVSQDGIAFLWDLNRLEFVRKLPLARPVECARIHDVSGEIMLCTGPNVLLYTLNGDLILDQNVCGAESPDDFIHSCAFYEGAGNEWLENFLVFTGHKRGRVNVWRRTVGKNGRWVLELVRRLDHVDTKSETGANVDAAITCITPMPQTVYTGDEDGRVYEWNLIQKE
ncbi:hypothetical protein VTK73DRAFT_1665 [Phialemonium thermophilum]|uniref:Uncharacterized protein n=1 Tax=Phialemonium thermophilum TaxID=223376 RepID=A0ABR3X8K3_9PEZI